VDKHLFETIDPLVNDIAKQITNLIDSETLNQLKQQLAGISRELSACSVTLDIHLHIFDRDREQNLPLLQTGLATSDGAVPHQVWGDSAPQRYLVAGDMLTVPDDHCPACWGNWSFKSMHPVCECCGAEMGRDVKLLLDTDHCPHCEHGTLTASQPECSGCGFTVNPDHVAWG